jgi:hypothetical protein
VLHKCRFTPCIGVLICLGMARVASSSAFAPNAIETMDGSTVSSPITFESFLAQVSAPSGFTGVRFLLTINDVSCGDPGGGVNCTSTGTDMVQIYYGPKTAQFGTRPDAFLTMPFLTPCTLEVTVGVSSAYTKTCSLSPTEADPNAVGSFVYDFNHTGVSIVAACFANCTNVFNQFFFSGSTLNTTDSSITFLPEDLAAVPEPATAAMVVLAMGAIFVLRLRNRAGVAYDREGTR